MRSLLLVVLAACSPPPTEAPFCGDGQLDPGEQCDDGNQVSGDGCSDACTVEQSRAVAWQIHDVLGNAQACPAGSTIAVTAIASSTTVETDAPCASGQTIVHVDPRATTLEVALLAADRTPLAGAPSQPIPDDGTPIAFSILSDGVLLDIDWSVIDSATGSLLACSDLDAFEVTLTATPVPPSMGPPIELQAPCEPPTSPGVNGKIAAGPLLAGRYTLALAVGSTTLHDLVDTEAFSAADVTESLLFVGER